MLLTALVHDAGDGVGPRVVGQELLRKNRQCLGGEADAAHVRNAQEGFAQKGDLIRAKLRGVPAGDEHVLDLGPRIHIGNGLAPAVHVHAELQLVDLLGIEADGVAARAKTAIHRTRGHGQEQHLVGIAVGKPGHRHVLPLVQRIQIDLGMVG